MRLEHIEIQMLSGQKHGCLVQSWSESWSRKDQIWRERERERGGIWRKLEICSNSGVVHCWWELGWKSYGRKQKQGNSSKVSRSANSPGGEVLPAAVDRRRKRKYLTRKKEKESSGKFKIKRRQFWRQQINPGRTWFLSWVTSSDLLQSWHKEGAANNPDREHST